MKTFLDAWLLEAPMGLSQELSGTVRLATSEQLPSREDSLYCRIEVQGGMKGSFWIAIEAHALFQLFVSARVTADELDAERDSQLWQGIIRQVAARAVKSAGKDATVPVSIANVSMMQPSVELTLTAYELRFGEVVARVAFADQTRPTVEVKTESNVVADMAPPVRGVELLLDVELDASLRFGSKEMPLSDVLELGPGDIVPLERHVSDPVDLIVGDRIVARGEVVLVNGNFGLRLTEVAEPRKSLESIRCLF